MKTDAYLRLVSLYGADAPLQSRRRSIRRERKVLLKDLRRFEMEDDYVHGK